MRFSNTEDEVGELRWRLESMKQTQMVLERADRIRETPLPADEAEAYRTSMAWLEGQIALAEQEIGRLEQEER